MTDPTTCLVVPGLQPIAPCASFLTMTNLSALVAAAATPVVTTAVTAFTPLYPANASNSVQVVPTISLSGGNVRIAAKALNFSLQLAVVVYCTGAAVPELATANTLPYIQFRIGVSDDVGTSTVGEDGYVVVPLTAYNGFITSNPSCNTNVVSWNIPYVAGRNYIQLTITATSFMGANRATANFDLAGIANARSKIIIRG